MNHEWVVVNCSVADAQAQLNSLDQQKYEIFATHPCVQDGTNGMTIIARRQKKQTGDVRY
jgi:hypothetical protein